MNGPYSTRGPASRTVRPSETPGIGPFIALLLVAEVDDIRRFPTAKRLASYTGLVPSLYASGGQRWGGAITRQGSTLLRWALVQAAHQATRSVRFSAYYQQQRERLGPGKATVAHGRNNGPNCVIRTLPLRLGILVREDRIDE